MSQPADGSTPAAPAANNPPPAPAQSDELDPTFKLLFDAADTEKKEPAPEAPAGKSLHEAIGGESPAPAKKEEPATPAQREEPTPAPAKPIRVRRKSEPAPAPAPVAPAAPAPAVPAAPKAPTADEQFEAGLLDEERDQLEIARYAEKTDPVKYKGYAAKVTKFLKDHAAYLEKNPKATEAGSEEREAYQAWLAKNNVALSPREARSLERQQIESRATEKALKEAEAKFGEIHDENFRRDKEPEIKREADQFFHHMAAEGLPDDLAKAVKEQGLEKAKAAYPLEYRIAAEEMTQAASDVEELRRITTSNPRTGRRLKEFDGGNPQHARIIGFIRQQCDDFKNGRAGESETERSNRLRFQVQDGKRFLSRDEYYSLPPEQRGPYWTFSVDQIVKLQGFAARANITARIKDEHAKRESDGWTRKPAATPAAQSPTPEPGAPPAPRAAPIPGTPSVDANEPDKAFKLLMGE